jgi:hypothetical protein
MSVKNLFDLTGKVALITGGSRGLGLQMAEALGEMGAKVAITARKADELKEAEAHLKKQGIEVLTVTNDLSKFEQIPAMVDAVLAKFGTIDILVNNAGATWGAPAEDHPDEAWNKVMNLNINAMFFLSREVGKRCMIPQKSGKIINIASVAGLSGSPKGMHAIAYPHEQGRGGELHPHAGFGVGPLQHQRERHLPRLLPLEDVTGPAEPDRRPHRRYDAARPAGRRRGPDGHGDLPRLGSLAPHHRAVHRGGRRCLHCQVSS